MAADSPLDSYSQIVTAVAAALTPKVASLRVPREGTRGGGRAWARPSSTPATGSC